MIGKVSRALWGIIVSLFFIFLPKISASLPYKIKHILNMIFGFGYWKQLMPIFLILLILGLFRNAVDFYAIYKTKIMILVLIDIGQIFLFLFLFIGTNFFNHSLIYLSYAMKSISSFALILIFAFDIIGNIVKLIR
jgi:hypothetical protein